MTDNHIVKMTEPREIQSSQMHPLVTAAMRSGEIDTETLSKLMDLQERWEKNEAKKTYTAAMVKLKAELPSTLNRDKTVDFTSKRTDGKVNYSFTTLASAMNAVSPCLTKFGFSLSWTPVTGERMVSVTCRLTHTDGHFEEATLSAAPDPSGTKNHVQAIGSTISYLQRYTALSLLGIATADMRCADEIKSDKTTVDANKNLQAVAWMQQQGIDVKDAESHVQRPVQQWTDEDLATLKEWIREQREKPNPTPDPTHDTDTDGYSAHQVRVINAAKGFWGGDEMTYMTHLDEIAKKCQDPFEFKTANPMQCNYLLQRIEEEANG